MQKGKSSKYEINIGSSLTCLSRLEKSLRNWKKNEKFAFFETELVWFIYFEHKQKHFYPHK